MKNASGTRSASATYKRGGQSFTLWLSEKNYSYVLAEVERLGTNRNQVISEIIEFARLRDARQAKRKV